MILIKQAHIIDPEGPHHDAIMDILIRDGRIAQIDELIEVQCDQILKIENLKVSIGWFDSSVSFGEPGFEERQSMENGLMTAAKSGFTNIMLNPNNRPNPHNASGINFLKSLSANNIVTLHPVGNFTVDQDGKHLAELYDMHMAGAISFYDFKNSIENPNILKVGLQYVKPFHAIIQSYPQDDQIAGNGVVNEDVTGTISGLKTIPKFAEELRVARDIKIAEYTDSALHIPTVTTGASLDLIKNAQDRGIDVTCSVSVHHLALNSESLDQYDTNYKIQPPLRDKEEVERLLDHISKGTVNMITSDHIPLTIESKEVEFDQAEYGTIGLESAFGKLNQLLDINKTISLLTGGYEVFLGSRPTINEGVEANLTFFTTAGVENLSKEDLVSTSKNSIFLGSELKGKVIGVFNNHKLIQNG